jgi:NAD(P)-dependent dehydrogenase (short-subunit alcohol dehydrogenase family)
MSARPGPLPLDGAVVAITGGARGIGRATAAAFLARGARVALGDLDGEAAQAAAAELGGGSVGLPLDVRSRSSFAAFLDAVQERHGPLGVLVNNAGVMPVAPFLEQDDATDRTTLDVNVLGPLNGMRLAAPRMAARGGGHVVNVVSMAGRLPMPGLAGYVASKHAALGLSLTVRRELRASGVTVTAILPSAVRTELSSGVPLGGGMPTVEPEQVAEAIVASCRRRPATVAVPRWVGPVGTAAALVPEPLMDAIRRLLRDDRAVTRVDRAARAAYEARVAAQTTEETR